MKTAVVLALLTTAAMGASAFTPTGLFIQDAAGRYRAIQIAEDGQSAVWISKDCPRCKADVSPREKVQDLGNAHIRIGKTDFFVQTNPAELFHPSLGSWGRATVTTSPRN